MLWYNGAHLRCPSPSCRYPSLPCSRNKIQETPCVCCLVYLEVQKGILPGRLPLMKWRLLKCPFLKPVVGRFFPQQPAHQSISLDCKKQDFKLFLLSVLALVFPLNDSVVISRTLGHISLGLV